MRLIDADALIMNIQEKEGEPDYQHEGEGWSVGLIMAEEIVDSAPTVDAVEVVRCIDCCHHEDEEPNMVYCPNIVGGWVQNDFFCKDGSRGERK